MELTEEFLVVGTDLFSVSFPWAELAEVYCAPSEGTTQEQVLCLKPHSGPPVVLAGLDLGDSTADVADEAVEHLGGAGIGGDLCRDEFAP